MTDYHRSFRSFLQIHLIVDQLHISAGETTFSPIGRNRLQGIAQLSLKPLFFERIRSVKQSTFTPLQIVVLLIVSTFESVVKACASFLSINLWFVLTFLWFCVTLTIFCFDRFFGRKGCYDFTRNAFPGQTGFYYSRYL